ncbi:hypothetical protein LPJ75_000404 [Coemansia sp. RSA 2598]|nr:hypothetical protein LPJ75_000404 [Coemansia sp. RSA 2598]
MKGAVDRSMAIDQAMDSTKMTSSASQAAAAAAAPSPSQSPAAQPAAAHLPASKTGDWLLWAEAVTKDHGIKQALRNPVLRNTLRYLDDSIKEHPGFPQALSLSLSSSLSSSIELASLSQRFSSQMQHGCAAAGPCLVAFCRSNRRYGRRLGELSRVDLQSLALELAARAARHPERREIQPHTAQQLDGRRRRDVRDATMDARSSEGTNESLFAARFNSQMARLLSNDARQKPAQGGSACAANTGNSGQLETVPEALVTTTAAAGGAAAGILRPAIKSIIMPQQPIPQPQQQIPQPHQHHHSQQHQHQREHVSRMLAPPKGLSVPCDQTGNPLVAVSRLDARTAPVVGAIGGRLLRNTVQLVFGSAELLMTGCFVAAEQQGYGAQAVSLRQPPPFGMDMPTALRFVADLAGHEVGALLLALRRGISGLETRLSTMAQRGRTETDAVARALAVAALVLATVDWGNRREHMEQGALQVRVSRLILQLLFFAEPTASASAATCCNDQDALLGWQARFAGGNGLRQQWLRWWAGVPAAVVRQWIGVLQDDALGSICQLQGGLTSDRTIAQRVAGDPIRWAGSLEMLRLLYDGNQALLSFGIDPASDERPRLAVPTAHSLGAADNVVRRAAFASRRILARFDLPDELRRWMACMRTRSASADEYVAAADRWAAVNIFSPFAYPFLFDFGSKVALLVGEMHERMAQRYLRAHDRQAELVQEQRMLGIDSHAEAVVGAGLLPEWPLLASNRAAVASASNPFLVLAVRRHSLVLDAFDMMSAGVSHVRFPLKVRFVASGEDGVDMGGVQKEFFAQLLPQLLRPDRGLFEFSDTGSGASESLWPNAASPHSLADFETVGMFLGVAFANNISMDSATAPLASALVSQLAFDGDQQAVRAARMPLRVLMRRLRPTFPSLVDGLQQLLDWDEADGSVQDVFCRTFEITVPDPFRVWHVRGESIAINSDGFLPPPFAHLPAPSAADPDGLASGGTVTFALIGDGGSVEVTAQNRELYVSRYLQFVAYEHARAQISALRRGFARAVDSIVYRMLSPADLVKWVGGLFSQAPIEAARLEGVAEYDDEYTSSHPVVRRFWRVVGDFDQRQLKQLLSFVTASDHLPLGGYEGITFVVQRNGPDTDRLPTALTCFGRLLLPAYSTDQKMRSLLLTAIENSSGFGLV